MKVSKGFEFPVVVVPGVEHMPALGKGETEAARVFYVAATKLLITASGESGFGKRLQFKPI